MTNSTAYVPLSLRVETINNNEIDLAIVEFHGLRSVMDIESVTLVGTVRYEIILENGTKKFANKKAIQRILDKEKSVIALTDVVYTIKNRFNKYSGYVEFKLQDSDGHEVTHIERNVSTIYQVGMEVIINKDNHINAAV